IAVAAVMAGEGAMTVVLRTLRAHAIPAPAFGSTLAVTIILVLLPLPLAGALIALVPADSIPLLLLACAILQGAALAVCFAGLRRHRSAYDLPGHRARASASESE
ncbi:MFS transporter, partial [Streptomyces sp. SID11233]|nr:MFS transporter [Streptomyces sp. SID11233]